MDFKTPCHFFLLLSKEKTIKVTVRRLDSTARLNGGNTRWQCINIRDIGRKCCKMFALCFPFLDEQ